MPHLPLPRDRRRSMTLPGVAVVVLVFLAIGGATVATTARPAAAEVPAGDTESFVTGIEPPSEAFAIRVLGGDETLRIDVRPGHEVVILGYTQEPYLRIDARGEVFENQRSPAVTANADRYNTGTPPPEADPDAPPDWLLVGSGGSYEWHDHRMHWMAESVPVPGEPGDLVFEWSVGLTVDSEPVTVTGELRRGHSAAALPWVLVTVVAAGAVVLLGRRAEVTTIAAAAGASTALAVGLTVGQRMALECWTCGQPLDLVPVVIATLAIVVLAVSRRAAVRVAAATLALVALTGWLLVQATVLWNPVVVTALPSWAARAATAAAVGLTVAGLVLAVRFGKRALDRYALLPPSQRGRRTRRAAPSPT